MKTPFSYTILRYIHNVATGEYLNVGVIVYSPELQFVQSRIQQNYSRLSSTFDGFNGEYYRKLAKHIENRVNALGDKIFGTLQFKDIPKDTLQLSASVLPKDDSNLQFAEVYYGITADPQRSLDELYDYFVLSACSQPTDMPRTHEEVWNEFQKSLAEHNIVQRLKPVTIIGGSFEYDFKHAWKNSKWHPLEAISMDAKESETLRDRAIKWVGRSTDLQSDEKLGTLYMLIGRPQIESHIPAYNKAVDLLHKMPIDHELIKEDEAEDFAVSLSGKIGSHDNPE